ncbi:unnamed protein product [Spirodela intermedia]|uniref:Uncharacterized protein n=1 Tax=Spirodela intermedia TaxID=51605 RepID=A0A7I8LHX8_SPIIN|nr:unnamed protein product [Spirodela intermedia]
MRVRIKHSYKYIHLLHTILHIRNPRFAVF